MRKLVPKDVTAAGNVKKESQPISVVLLLPTILFCYQKGFGLYP